MKRARFTKEQIIGVLREHEAGAKISDLAQALAKREAVAHAGRHGLGLSDRRACCIVSADRKMVRYKPRPPDTELRGQLRVDDTSEAGQIGTKPV